MSVRQGFLFFLVVFFVGLVFALCGEANGQSSGSARTVWMKVTAYCTCEKCCGEFALRQAQGKRTTALGDDATVYDGVAADPKLLPYRTRLRIPGVADVKEVDDTGGGMRRDAKRGITHIDVRMKSHAEARRWGVKWLEVKVLDSPKVKGVIMKTSIITQLLRDGWEKKPRSCTLWCRNSTHAVFREQPKITNHQEVIEGVANVYSSSSGSELQEKEFHFVPPEEVVAIAFDHREVKD